MTKRESLERCALGIGSMFAIYWLYSLFFQARLALPGLLKSLLGLALLYGPGTWIFLQITKNIPKVKVKRGQVGNKTILQCVLLQFTATLVMAVTTLVLSFGKGIAEPTTVFLSPFMLFLLLIINPIVEEVIFRKLLAQRLLKHGESFFIFSSSFCFALVHGVSQGVPQIFYTFIIGLVLAYLYVKTGSLKLPILLHSLSNLFGAVILQLIQRVSLEVAGMYSLFLMFLGVIGLIWFIKTRKQIILDNKSGLLGKEVLRDLLTNRGVIIYTLFTALVILLK